MTVVLVVMTFVILLSIEYFMNRKRVKAAIPVTSSAPPARIRPEVVAGFALPANLSYHLGHMWAASESPTNVRVGLDDFAARLLGRVEKVMLPQRGQWIRQGQKLVTLFRNGGFAEMMSPIEGIVLDVNDDVVRDPGLALKDPYGKGWLLTVNSPDAHVNFRNLLNGTVARRWMEEAASRLRARLLTAAPALAQDGGLAVSDITNHLDQQKWVDLTHEFFLS